MGSCRNTKKRTISGEMLAAWNSNVAVESRRIDRVWRQDIVGEDGCRILDCSRRSKHHGVVSCCSSAAIAPELNSNSQEMQRDGAGYSSKTNPAPGNAEECLIVNDSDMQPATLRVRRVNLRTRRCKENLKAGSRRHEHPRRENVDQQMAYQDDPFGSCAGSRKE